MYTSFQYLIVHGASLRGEESNKLQKWKNTAINHVFNQPKI